LRSLFSKYRERFIRPLLSASTESEAKAALRAHKLEYIASKASAIAVVLALKGRDWMHVTPQEAEEFYSEIQARLERSGLSHEIAQKVDYVAYAMCQIGLRSMSLTRKGLRGLRAARPAPPMSTYRALRDSTAFDLLTSAAMMGATEPAAIRDPAVFSWLMDRAVLACDSHIALLSHFE
jgi:hypothetical protein